MTPIAETTDSTPPDAVLLMAGGTLGWIVANDLNRRIGPLTVIEETGETKEVIFRRRARMLGLVPALGQVACSFFLRVIFRNKDRLKAIWAANGFTQAPDPALTVHKVPSINSPECHALLKAFAPKVVAVYGTRILKRETLRSIDAPFINYHAGINPKYRGQDPGYWALASGDPENAGVTIHLVDEGVDTGDVLYQARVTFDPADNIKTYQHVQAAAALPLFARAIEDARQGRLDPRKVNLPSQQFFPPTIWSYLANGLFRGVW